VVPAKKQVTKPNVDASRISLMLRNEVEEISGQSTRLSDTGIIEREQRKAITAKGEKLFGSK
jgi:hypothetical protein